jgi:hypothetical protein
MKTIGVVVVAALAASNQISMVSQSMPFSRATVSRRVGKLF